MSTPMINVLQSAFDLKETSKAKTAASKLMSKDGIDTIRALSPIKFKQFLTALNASLAGKGDIQTFLASIEAPNLLQQISQINQKKIAAAKTAAELQQITDGINAISKLDLGTFSKDLTAAQNKKSDFPATAAAPKKEDAAPTKPVVTGVGSSTATPTSVAPPPAAPPAPPPVKAGVTPAVATPATPAAPSSPPAPGKVAPEEKKEAEAASAMAGDAPPLAPPLDEAAFLKKVNPPAAKISPAKVGATPAKPTGTPTAPPGTPVKAAAPTKAAAMPAKPATPAGSGTPAATPGKSGVAAAISAAEAGAAKKEKPKAEKPKAQTKEEIEKHGSKQGIVEARKAALMNKGLALEAPEAVETAEKPSTSSDVSAGFRKAGESYDKERESFSTSAKASAPVSYAPIGRTLTVTSAKSKEAPVGKPDSTIEKLHKDTVQNLQRLTGKEVESHCGADKFQIKNPADMSVTLQKNGNVSCNLPQNDIDTFTHCFVSTLESAKLNLGIKNVLAKGLQSYDHLSVVCYEAMSRGCTVQLSEDSKSLLQQQGISEKAFFDSIKEEISKLPPKGPGLGQPLSEKPEEESEEERPGPDKKKGLR